MADSRVRTRRGASAILLVAAMAAAAACGAGADLPVAGDLGLPVPRGVDVQVGLDGDGSFLRFTSDLEPDLALAEYGETLTAAGFTPAGSSRGWTSFTDGARTIAARAEPGPPTVILVREIAAALTPASPGTAPGFSAAPGSPVPGGSAKPSIAVPTGQDEPGTTDGATPAPARATATPKAPGTSGAKANRKPDPPHGNSSGNGNGKGNGNGNGTGNGKGKGNGKGATPTQTPVP